MGHNGYLKVSLYCDDGVKTPSLHVLVAKAFHPEGRGVVRHLDGDRLNCAADNLEWSTQAQNIADQAMHGTRTRWRDRKHLTVSEVRLIRSLRASGETIVGIARKVGCSWQTVSRITRGLSWVGV